MRNKQLQATVLSVAQVKKNVGLVYVNTASLIIQLLYLTFPLSDFEIFFVLNSLLLYFCISIYFCFIFLYSLSSNLSRLAEHALIACISIYFCYIFFHILYQATCRMLLALAQDRDTVFLGRTRQLRSCLTTSQLVYQVRISRIALHLVVCTAVLPRTIRHAVVVRQLSVHMLCVAFLSSRMSLMPMRFTVHRVLSIFGQNWLL